MKKAVEKQEVKYYDNLEIPLYNWDRFVSTSDNNWFIVGYDGRQPKISTQELIQAQNFVMDEYFRALNDKSFTNKIKKYAQVDHIKVKYNAVKLLLDRCWMGFTVDQEEARFLFFDMLGKFGYKIEYRQSQDQDQKRLLEIRTALEGLETKMNILLSELVTKGKAQKQDLIKQLRIATLALGYKERLKIKDLTLIEWIDICKAVEEQSQKN